MSDVEILFMVIVLVLIVWLAVKINDWTNAAFKRIDESIDRYYKAKNKSKKVKLK